MVSDLSVLVESISAIIFVVALLVLLLKNPLRVNEVVSLLQQMKSSVRNLSDEISNGHGLYTIQQRLDILVQLMQQNNQLIRKLCPKNVLGDYDTSQTNPLADTLGSLDNERKAEETTTKR